MATNTSGEWLSRQMERRGVTVRVVADALGVTPKTVYDWVGNKTAISEERVPLLADVLGVSELETRRGLGFWVPAKTEQIERAIDRGELEQLRADIESVLERIDRLQRGL